MFKTNAYCFQTMCNTTNITFKQYKEHSEGNEYVNIYWAELEKP